MPKIVCVNSNIIVTGYSIEIFFEFCTELLHLKKKKIKLLEILISN